LADRLEDVFHGYGFLLLSAPIAQKSSMARPRRSGLRSLLRCSVCKHSQGPKNCQGCASGMRKGHDLAEAILTFFPARLRPVRVAKERDRDGLRLEKYRPGFTHARRR
jgi:hypothetical protein